MVLILLVGVPGIAAIADLDEASRGSFGSAGGELDLHGPFGGDGDSPPALGAASETFELPIIGATELTLESDLTEDGLVFGSAGARLVGTRDLGPAELDELEVGVARDASGAFSSHADVGVRGELGGVAIASGGHLSRDASGAVDWRVDASADGEVAGVDFDVDGALDADGLEVEATASAVVAEGVEVEVRGRVGTDGAFAVTAGTHATLHVADGVELRVVASATLDEEGVSYEGSAYATYEVSDDVKVHVEGSYDSEGNFEAAVGGEVVVEVLDGEVTIAPEGSVDEAGDITLRVHGEAEGIEIGGVGGSGEGTVTVNIRDGRAEIDASGSGRLARTDDDE